MSNERNRRKPSKARATPGEQYLQRRANSSVWQICFKIGKRRFRESSGTTDKVAAASLAEKRWHEVWRAIHLGEVAPAELDLHAACRRYYEEVGSTSEYGRRGQLYHFRILLQALGDATLLSRLTDERINAAVQWMRTRKPARKGRPVTLSGASINRYLTTLSVVCRRAAAVWGVRVGSWHKALHVQREAAPREVFLDYDQARRLVASANGHLRPILLLALLTGLRRENLVRLAWENVSLDLARAVLVQKGGRRLSVPLAPAAVELLASIEPDTAARRGPVFRFGNPHVACTCPRCTNRRYAGQPVHSVKRTLATAIHAAGLDALPEGHLRFHDLRHTFASWALAEGGDLKLVQEALGHKHITTTARYAHLVSGRREAVANAVADRLLSPAGKRKRGPGASKN